MLQKRGIYGIKNMELTDGIIENLLRVNVPIARRFF